LSVYYGLSKIADNGLGLGEVGDFENETLKLWTNVNRANCTKPLLAAAAVNLVGT